jgi:ABC-type multidrug transport system permease subunit
MDQVVVLFIAIIISVFVALLGSNRKIGYGWSLFFCIIFSPIIGLIIILFSKKNDIEFVDVNKKGDEL